MTERAIHTAEQHELNCALQHIAVAGPPPARLAFIDAGRADAPPILFIHGVGGLHEQWSAQLPAFVGTHRCLVPTLRGHSPSEATKGPYSMAQLRGDLEQFLDGRCITQPVDIVAHSYGGLIGLDLALCHPERVRKLVLIGLAEYMNFGAFFRMIATFPAPNTLLDWGRRLFLSDRFHASVATLRAVMREAILPWEGWQALPHLPQPVLLLAGQYDVVAPPPAIRNLARRFPHARTGVIRNARHKVQLQQPEAVNRKIAAFLGGEG